GAGARNRSRARSRAAGKRQASTTLPGANVQCLARTDLRNRDVGAFREDRMVFQQRPELFEVVGPDVFIDPEDRVRIAHRGDRWRMQHRRVNRADLELDGAGVAKLLGERNVLPVKARLAHIDGDEAILVLDRVDDAGERLEGKNLLVGLGGQRRDDAAGAVAAGLRQRAVRIYDLDIKICACETRIVDRHDLIEMRGRIGGKRNRGVRRNAIHATTHIGNNDLVADAVHLGKGSGRTHGRYMAETTRNYQCRRGVKQCRSRPYRQHQVLNWARSISGWRRCEWKAAWSRQRPRFSSNSRRSSALRNLLEGRKSRFSCGRWYGWASSLSWRNRICTAWAGSICSPISQGRCQK